MENPKITKVYFSTIDKKWYLTIDSINFICKLPFHMELSEKDAMAIIKEYEFEEFKPFSWRPIK